MVWTFRSSGFLSRAARCALAVACFVSISARADFLPVGQFRLLDAFREEGGGNDRVFLIDRVDDQGREVRKVLYVNDRKAYELNIDEAALYDSANLDSGGQGFNKGSQPTAIDFSHGTAGYQLEFFDDQLSIISAKNQRRIKFDRTDGSNWKLEGDYLRSLSSYETARRFDFHYRFEMGQTVRTDDLPNAVGSDSHQLVPIKAPTLDAYGAGQMIIAIPVSELRDPDAWKTAKPRLLVVSRDKVEIHVSIGDFNWNQKPWIEFEIQKRAIGFLREDILKSQKMTAGRRWERNGVTHFIRSPSISHISMTERYRGSSGYSQRTLKSMVLLSYRPDDFLESLFGRSESYFGASVAIDDKMDRLSKSCAGNFGGQTP